MKKADVRRIIKEEVLKETGHYEREKRDYEKEKEFNKKANVHMKNNYSYMKKREFVDSILNLVLTARRIDGFPIAFEEQAMKYYTKFPESTDEMTTQIDNIMELFKEINGIKIK